ncbi:LysE family transporter [Haloarculaceae archaeon H-GB2-1]|nr:LysE family transporter [Haloarculaceae archaeon H-GB1-1]MEA5386181.1 LysE family transporter [Haloarculaceae archaeon H-GB11]MEA5407687.1 LysE family transporter [Haloarculaceae archaeon H-GB2-1]
MTALGALSTLFVGAVFGMALAAPPGPMNAVIAEESVVRGWLAGFMAGLGALSADFVFFVLSLVGAVAFIGNFPTLRAAMVGVGGVLMLYFAYGAVQDARETFTATSDDVEEDSKGFRKAFVLALSNPYQILFWLTVGVGLLQPGTVDVFSHVPYVSEALTGVLVVQTGSPALLVGFFVGILVWIVGFPASLIAVGQKIDRFAPIVAGGSSLVLVGFGLVFLWDAATTLLL